MKRKQDIDPELLARLSENIHKLIAAAERLAGAADYSRRQIDRLAQLINRVEDILRRTGKPGISIEGEREGLQDEMNYDDPNRDDARCDHGRPVNLNPDDGPSAEYFVDFGFGHFVEFSSYDELKKFQKLPPISGDDIELCDFDEMIRQLLSNDGEGL